MKINEIINEAFSQAAADMGMSFCGVTHHLNRGSPGYTYITADEYLLRVEELNKNSTIE
jgi:hypothetical protein